MASVPSWSAWQHGPPGQQLVMHHAVQSQEFGTFEGNRQVNQPPSAGKSSSGFWRALSLRITSTQLSLGIRDYQGGQGLQWTQPCQTTSQVPQYNQLSMPKRRDQAQLPASAAPNQILFDANSATGDAQRFGRRAHRASSSGMDVDGPTMAGAQAGDWVDKGDPMDIDKPVLRGLCHSKWA